jgi:hypothetical protein
MDPTGKNSGCFKTIWPSRTVVCATSGIENSGNLMSCSPKGRFTCPMMRLAALLDRRFVAAVAFAAL